MFRRRHLHDSFIRFPCTEGRLGGLIRWGRAIVARTYPLRILDLKHATSAPVTVPGLDDVDFVGGDTVRFAGGRRNGVLTVLRERGQNWEQLPAPRSLQEAPELIMAARRESVAVLWSGRDQPFDEFCIGWWDGQHWQSAIYTLKGQRGWPEHLLLSDGRLLLGFDRGEFGGGLWSASASGMIIKVAPPGDLPVQGLVSLPGGRVLVGTGLSHLGLNVTHVGVLAPDGRWETLVRAGVSFTPGFWAKFWPRYMLAERRSKLSKYEVHQDEELFREACVNKQKYRVVRNLPADSLDGVDVDAQGRPHLLTGSHGVLRLEQGNLTQVTQRRPWKESLHGKGLVLQDDFAVIGTFDRGVLLWKLETDEVRRIRIPRLTSRIRALQRGKDEQVS